MTSLQFEILKDYIDRNIAVKSVGVRTTYHNDLKRVFAEVELERPWEIDTVAKPCVGCSRNAGEKCSVDGELIDNLHGLWSCSKKVTESTASCSTP